MMTALLLVLSIFTAGASALAVYIVWKHTNPKEEMSTEQVSEIEKTLVKAFKDSGIDAKVQAVPRTPMEAIMVHSRENLNALRESDRMASAWFKHLELKLNVNKRDIDSLMAATEKIAKAMLSLIDMHDKKSAPEEPASVDTFVHSLEYARDVYAKTPTQKKAVESIISSIKTEHGRK